MTGQGRGSFGSPVGDGDLRPAPGCCLGGQPAHTARSDDQDRLIEQRSCHALNLVQSDITQGPRRPGEPSVGAPSSIQRDLKQPVKHWVQGPRGMTHGVGLAHLMEDLILAQDRAVQTTCHVDEVACGCGVLQSQPPSREVGKRGVAERAQGDVQLDPVAGVYQDDRVIGR